MGAAIETTGLATMGDTTMGEVTTGTAATTSGAGAALEAAAAEAAPGAGLRFLRPAAEADAAEVPSERGCMAMMGEVITTGLEMVVVIGKAAIIGIAI